MRLSFACFAVGSCAEVHFEADYHAIESCPLIRRTRFNLCLTEVSYQQQLNRPLYLNEATSLYRIEPLFWHPPFFFVSTLQSSTLPSFAVLAAQFGEARRWSEESWRKKPRSSTSIRNQRLPWSWPVRSRMGLHWAPPIQTHLTTICYHTIFLIQIQITGRYVSFSIAFYALSTPTRIILHQAVIQFLCSP